jgi:2-iminobutanoate/2-iminopropanoate deaminase
MEKRIHETKKAPAPVGPYSQAVEVDGWVMCSGQIPLDPLTGEMLKGDIQAQTKLVMSNIAAVLQGAELGFEHIVKTTIFLVNMSDFAAVNEVYAKYFKDKFPARSTIAVQALPKGAQVEIEVLARRM